MARGARHGFTLVELLVAVTIIAVLAAILFPVFAKARDKARQAHCQSNLRQMTAAVLMYASDYDDQTPSANFRADLILIQPYLKNQDVFRCPSDSGYYDVCGDHITGSHLPSVRIPNGYVANACFFGGAWFPSPNPYRSHRLEEFDQPTEMPIYADHHGNHGIVLPSVWPGHVFPAHPDDGGTNGSCRIRHRHTGTCSFGFGDGHVKPLSKTPEQAKWVGE